MGRELRRVPANWEHPRKANGRYQPLYDESYRAAAEQWIKDFRGMPPDKDFYRPDWTDEERTHFQMYENTTEGTPISPVFADVESLCHWLTDNGASSFGKMTASYEQWLGVCRSCGYAPSLVVVDGQFVDGVTFIGGAK